MKVQMEMETGGFSHYMRILNHPPLEAKGFTRWWWYGSAVTEDEIDRELGLIREAELGGVELQITYPMQGDDPELGVAHEPFFSPGFFAKIDYTLRRAEELGLWADLTLGSGWPFGGPFVPYEMAPQVLIPYQIDIIGPTDYRYDFTSTLSGHLYKAVIGKFENGRLVENTMIDVTDRVKETWLYNWQWGHELNAIEIPEGHWKLYIFVVNLYKQTVGKPAPGMEGYAIDHCRADVAAFYFQNFGDPLVDKLGEGRIRAFFCDSIELGGNNWTSILLEEFQKRRGYDLSPYMPALWAEIGDITQDIRYDYYRTFSELTVENFFRKFAEWCHSRGAKSRIQAHGTWGDILQAYAAADFPEGETFGEHDKYEVNTIHRRLASSAGHLYGKNIISNETFTWLRKTRFMETLEMMKAAVDAVFLDGMNQIVNHGYSYSPESAGKPGWAFYASSFISHNNTWWEYYPYLSRYIHTVSAFLQLGRSFAEIGIYLPQADIWASMPMAELHMAMKLEQHIGRDFVNNIQKSGYYFDYINDEAIEHLASFSEEGMNIEASCFKVLILPRVTRITVPLAMRLKDFVTNGGTLICLGHPPSCGCGFIDRLQQQLQVKEAMKEIFGTATDRWHNLGKGKSIVVPDEAAVIKRLRESRQPMVRISAASCNQLETSCRNIQEEARAVIGFVHRKRGEEDIYFISNISVQEHLVNIAFAHKSANMVIIDPMKRQVVRAKTSTDGDAQFSIHFDPYQSYVIVFSSESIGEETMELASVNCEPEKSLGLVDVSFDWELSIDELQLRKKLAKITTWEQFTESRYYSGAGYYEKIVYINAPEGTRKIYLVLENVHETAEVMINGQSAGVLWKAPRKLEITSFVRQGRNEFRIKVVNLWINHIINPDNPIPKVTPGVMDRWPYFNAAVGEVRNPNLYAGKERETIKQPIPSGLSGFVSIEYVR